MTDRPPRAGERYMAATCRARWLLMTCLGITLWAFGAGISHAQSVQEDLLKAAVVFKLTRYVDWPDATLGDGESEKLRLCVIGRSSVVDALETSLKLPDGTWIADYVRLRFAAHRSQ